MKELSGRFNTSYLFISIKRAFLIPFLVLLPLYSYSIEPLILTNEGEDYFVLNSNLNLLEDKKGTLSFNEILGGEHKLFQEYSDQLTVNKQGAVYWVKIDVLNKSDNGKHFIFELVDFRIDELEVYLPDGTNYKKYTTGDAVPFYSKDYNHKNFIFTLPEVRNQTYSIYFRVKVTQKKQFVLYSKIRTFQNLVEYSTAEYFLLALFYGIILCMILYNIFLFLNTKEVVHIIFCFYITSLGLFSLSRIDGIGFQYLWPSFPHLNAFFSVVTQTSFIAGAMIFAIYFLSTKKNNYFFHRVLVFAMAFRIIIGVVFVLAFPEDESFRIYDTFFLSLIVMPAFQSFRKKELVTRHYFVSFLFTYLGFVIYTLRDFQIIPFSTMTYYSLNIGIIGEVIFLSLAITEKSRILILEKQKEQAEKISHLNENEKLKNELIEELQQKEKLKDKVNRELEAKVSERTSELNQKKHELEELNVKLAEQAKEINRMASLLDKENWELKKELKKETQARVTNRFVSYEEFLKIYPDEFSCLKYLSELKWNENFQCSKCDNTKFSLNRTNLSRKCTRCATIESVTNSTIFHGVRFPLNKALYIVYFATHSAGKVNLTELSEELDLRPATCRKFFQTVREKKEKIRQLQSGEVNSMENVIL